MREVIATGKTIDEAIENGYNELGLTRDEVSVEILETPVHKLFKKLPARVRVTADEPYTDKASQQEEKQDKKPGTQKPDAKPEKAEENIQKIEENSPAKKAHKTPADHVLEAEPEEPIDLAADKAAHDAVEYLSGIFVAMGASELNISAFKQGDATLLRVEGESLADVMEVRGDTIQALSYLTDRAVNKGVDKRDEAYLRVRLDIAGYRNRREAELVALAEKTGAEVARSKRSRTLSPMNSYERLIVHTTISRMEGLSSSSIGSDTERRVVIRSTAADASEGEDWKPQRSHHGHGGGHNRNSGSRGGRGGAGGGRDRERGERDNNRRGGGGRGGYGGGQRPSSTPEREYADKPRASSGQGPVVPERRDAIRDGEDLPLYGKIEL